MQKEQKVIITTKQEDVNEWLKDGVWRVKDIKVGKVKIDPKANTYQPRYNLYYGPFCFLLERNY